MRGYKSATRQLVARSVEHYCGPLFQVKHYAFPQASKHLLPYKGTYIGAYHVPCLQALLVLVAGGTQRHVAEQLLIRAPAGD